MSLCYICTTHQGEVCKIPYVDLETETTGVTSLSICGGCWQKAGHTTKFPMFIDPMLIAMSAEVPHIVASVLKTTVKNYDPLTPEFQKFARFHHPEFAGVCHKCKHHQQAYQRQIPWETKDGFTMFETVLCQGCWKSLILSPGSMPFRGDTWWDAFQLLKAIDFYEDLMEAAEEEEAWIEEKPQPLFTP